MRPTTTASQRPSFWGTLPGLLAQLTALIVAITGLLTFLFTQCHWRQCPRIDGNYRSPGGAVMPITQTRCHITGSFKTDAGYNHEMSGDWDAQHANFYYIMLRTNPNGKQTKMFGTISVPNNDQIRVKIDGNDGQDPSLSTNYQEDKLWFKQ
jgi:hypothetical protein